MKKRIAKLSIIICAIALFVVGIVAVAACGDKGTVYTYSGVSIEEVGNTGGTSDVMETMYDTMYKDSTITVSDSKIVWKISSVDSVMSVSKDGEKYVLAGDYVNQMKTALTTSLGATTVNFDMYGLEKDGGFDIVMSASATMNVMGTNVTVGDKVTVSFVK